MNKLQKNKPKKNESDFIQKLKEILNQELKNFLENNKIDFYLKSEENEQFRKIFKSFIDNSCSSIFVIGNKGSGKSYLVKNLLRKNDFMFLDLFKLQEKIFFFDTKLKREKFIDCIEDYELMVFDNLESIFKNKTLKKVIYLVKKRREDSLKKNIFISFCDNEKNFHEKYKWIMSDNDIVVFLNSPSSDFLIKMIKSVLFKYYGDIKITESAISYLSFLLGNNLKVLINNLFKLFIFLDSFNYKVDILDEKNLKKILREISIFKEKKQLINFENNSQLEAICKKRKFLIDEIKSNSKKRNIVFERDQVIYILKNKLNFSSLDIAKILLKSPTGIMYSIKKIDKKRKSETFKNYFDYLIDITEIEV